MNVSSVLHAELYYVMCVTHCEGADSLEKEESDDKFQTFVIVHVAHINIISEKTFLQYFLAIMKHSLQNYENILRTCFFGNKFIVICLVIFKPSTP